MHFSNIFKCAQNALAMRGLTGIPGTGPDPAKFGDSGPDLYQTRPNSIPSRLLITGLCKKLIYVRKFPGTDPTKFRDPQTRPGPNSIPGL